jgi:Tfp pilus assembly protein PilV
MRKLSLTKLVKINNRGDTILEVVIAITLLALLLTGALALTQKNLQAEQSSQEHNEALQLAQSQIEELRNYATNNVLPSGNPFCLVASGASVGYADTPSQKCDVNAAGAASPTSIQPNFVLTVTPPAAGSSLYSISVDWQDVNGLNKDNVTLYYQIYSS